MENTEKNERNNTILGWFPKNKTFIAELELIDDNENTAYEFLNAAIKGSEILPGLKVHKMYRGIETLNSVLNIKKKDFLTEFHDELTKMLIEVKETIKHMEFEEIKPKEYGREYISKC